MFSAAVNTRLTGYDRSRSVWTVGPQNFECETRGAKTVIDVHDRNARTAAGQHRVQGDEATLGNACAYRRGDADYWRAKESRYNGGQRAIHAGNDDADPRGGELGQNRLQAMNAGDSDIEVSSGRYSHRVQRCRSFERNSDVCSTGGDHRNGCDVPLRPAVANCHPRFTMNGCEFLEHVHLLFAQSRSDTQL